MNTLGVDSAATAAPRRLATAWWWNRCDTRRAPTEARDPRPPCSSASRRSACPRRWPSAAPSAGTWRVTCVWPGRSDWQCGQRVGVRERETIPFLICLFVFFFNKIKSRVVCVWEGRSDWQFGSREGESKWFYF